MSDKFLSCNGFGLSPNQMVAGLLHTSKTTKLPGWLQYADRDSIFTYQGRCAIGVLCKVLNIGPGDEALVPAYNCGAEIDPFVWAGARPVFYRVDNRARIDVEDIMRRVTPSTRVIHVTHYFGWPQDIRELADWCKEKELFLVEDCAQSLFSRGTDESIGRLGDAAIYSFVKSLPVTDGGALVIRKGVWKENILFMPPRLRHTFRNCLPLLKKWFMHNNKSWQHYEFTRKYLTKSWLKRKPQEQSRELHPEMLKSNYFDEQKIDWSVTSITQRMLRATNPQSIVEKRRRNFQYLHDALSYIPKVTLLFDDLPQDVCPLSFPVLVADRIHWYKALTDQGILVLGWPGYYPGVDWEDFPEACNLKDNLFTLPVHQSLDIEHMEYIVSCVKHLADGKISGH